MLGKVSLKDKTHRSHAERIIIFNLYQISQNLHFIYNGIHINAFL